MNRCWHHYEKWECVSGGMYETVPPDRYDSESALIAYTEFLGSIDRFKEAMLRVMQEWPVSCEQFLTNSNINRIAWLGQSSMCISTGVPRQFKAGFSRLTKDQQLAANAAAGLYLRAWESEYGEIQFQPELETEAPKGLQNRILHYIRTWECRGYTDGIPDEVPSELMRLNLAPSHKAIALTILKNDHAASSLGYSQPVSPWYNAIKRVELEARNTMNDPMF